MLRLILAPLTPVALVVITALAQEPPPTAGPQAPVAPLFASHDLLTFAIEAPLSTIFKDRGKERHERPAKLILPGSDGQPVRLDVDIRTRGKTRAERRICEFPPLRLDFDTAAHGTVFEGHNDLKLVTHCQDGRAEYEQYVLQEYLVYRVYNLLTDLSFRARLARVTYVDTDGKRDAVTRYAFLLEDVDAMAARNGWQALRVPAVPPHLVNPRSIALVGVFQYMIGNPDWSLFTVEPGEEACCHNTVPIGAESGPIFSVPYDFDVSGIVNTRYADRLFGPEQRNLGIRRVRERAYRGLCASAQHLPEIFALFNPKRDAIYALYREQPGLDAGVAKATLEYLDAFYDTINDPRKVEREFAKRCMG
jgi:hypothetical protein